MERLMALRQPEAVTLVLVKRAAHH